MEPEAHGLFSSQDRDFHTTRWTLVLAAGARQAPDAHQALETLCRRYWLPLYLYVRRKGYGIEDTEDLIQGFFTNLIEKDLLARVEQGRGRFRSFLISALAFHIANTTKKDHALKRGGDQVALSLDLDAAEGQYQAMARNAPSPDVLYMRQWTQTLLDRASRRLRSHYAAQGRGQVFAQLEGFLVPGEASDPLAQVARDLNITTEAARACLCRMRKKFRDFMRDEVAETVDDPSQVDEELRNLWTGYD